MEVQAALQVLGVNRTVWIDDIFSTSREQLANKLIEHLDEVQALGFENLSATINEFDEDQEALRSYIEAADDEEVEAIRRALLEHLAHEAGTVELTDAFVGKMRSLMNIEQGDCWDFPEATDHIVALCGEATENIGCIVDLNNGLGDPSAGAGTLRILSDQEFRGFVFMLTHEATTATEAAVEKRIRDSLRQEMGDKPIPPVCVISKERFGDFQDDAVIEESLRIAVKRAGLRRSVYDVLAAMRPQLTNAFTSAQEKLYTLAPEQLDRYIVDKSFEEGLSELSVVERAVTAEMATEIRKVFANSNVAQDSAMRMRQLRAIDLKIPTTEKIEESLAFFRKLEIWEDDKLINESLSPLASGDLFAYDRFEFAPSERATRKIQRFLLLGQPCDIQRRGDGRRRAATAFLVPLTEKSTSADGTGDKFWKPDLPFKLHDSAYAIDFNAVATVRLDVLELACFRKDGRVCYEKDQPLFPLLPGLQKQLSAIKPRCEKEFETPLKGALKREIEEFSHLLAFGAAKPLANATTCKHKPAIQIDEEKLGERVTWGLRREGRIRAPFAAALLRSYLAVLGREAYEIDFTKHRDHPEQAAASVLAAVTQPATTAANNGVTEISTSTGEDAAAKGHP